MEQLTTAKAMYASFSKLAQADKAVDSILDFGLPTEHISLVAKVAGPMSLRPSSLGNWLIDKVGNAKFGLGIGTLATAICVVIPGVCLVVGGGPLAKSIAGSSAGRKLFDKDVLIHLEEHGVPAGAIVKYGLDYGQGGAILAVAVPTDHFRKTAVRQIVTTWQGNHIGAYEIQPS